MTSFLFLIAATITFPELEKRKERDVCVKYADLYVARASSPVWTGPDEQCATGSHSAMDREDTVRRVNFFRWLVGLTHHEVTENTAYKTQCMECATVLSAIRSLSHSLTPDMPCYTEAAATAAGTSNLAGGYGTSAATITGYMDDNGVSSLGHRRWIIMRSLGEVGIGYRGVYGALKVIGVKAINDEQEAPFVAFPAPGWQPNNLIFRDWSIAYPPFRQLNTGQVTGTITRDDGEVMASSLTKLDSGYGDSETFSFRLADRSLVQIGHSYKVEINIQGGDTLSYTVKSANCTGFVRPILSDEKISVVFFASAACLSLIVVGVISAVRICRAGGGQEKPATQKPTVVSKSLA